MKIYVGGTDIGQPVTLSVFRIAIRVWPKPGAALALYMFLV